MDSTTTGESRQATWLIRRATADDKEGVDELQRRMNRPSRSNSVISEYFVAVSKHAIVGCAAVRKRGNLGYLYGLVVDKSWRRKGIGHALTQQRLEWLCDQNVASVFVMAMFWNIKFFKKHGFILAGKGNVRGLEQLHGDFSDSWSVRSALLIVNLSLSRLSS